MTTYNEGEITKGTVETSIALLVKNQGSEETYRKDTYEIARKYLLNATDLPAAVSDDILINAARNLMETL
jgi:hypothetical protein